MDIRVINRDWESETPDLLGSFYAPFVFADAYASDGLTEILEVRIARGERGILVVDCTRAHVQAVLEWGTCYDDGQLQDLEIFLVRRD